MSVIFDDVIARVQSDSPGARSPAGEQAAAAPAQPPDRDPARIRRARAEAVQLLRREARLRAT